MNWIERRRLTAHMLAVVAMIWTLGSAYAGAQTRQPPSYIDTGTTIQVRTSQPIDTSTVDGRVFTGTVDQDVRYSSGRIVIPRGAVAELVTRRGSNNEMYLDLDSINVNGQRYGINAAPKPVATGGVDIRNSGIGNNQETLEHVGGGALLGTVIGAIAGGAKGAAVGAAAGAAVGAGTQVLTHGGRVSIPAESVITYRLQSGLDLGVRDTGFDRNGLHYHHYRGEPGYDGY